MIDYKKEYDLLGRLYNTTTEVIPIPDSGVEIHNRHYTSTFPAEYSDNGVVMGNLYYFELTQGGRDENNHFVYPVMVPTRGEGSEEAKFDKAILFFHGLNERAWNKYLPWAKYLAERCGRPVIMFPIAYHMGRAPKSWSNPRNMMEVAKDRNNGELSSTFANAALSVRLEKNPERFLISGVQSYYDVIDIVGNIKAGGDPLFEKGAHIDIFSYSIGAFLSEILLLNNFNDLFRDCRLFMFCGGTTFDSMNGISKYIMDEKAFESVMSLNNPKKLKRMGRNFEGATKSMKFKRTWNGIGVMMNSKERRKEREKLLNKCAHNIYAVALEKDSVMPYKKIVRTLKGKKGDIPTRVEVIDFPYDYSHEVPFPTGDDKVGSLVNRCFTVIFNNVANFYLIGDSVREKAERYRLEKAEQAERAEQERREKEARVRAAKAAKQEQEEREKASKREQKEQTKAAKREQKEQAKAAKRELKAQRKATKAEQKMQRKAEKAQRKAERKAAKEQRKTAKAERVISKE